MLACWAYSDDGGIDCGPVCPMCIEEGPARMEEWLEKAARHARIEAKEAEALAAEGVSEAPTIEDFRAMERMAAQ